MQSKTFCSYLTELAKKEPGKRFLGDLDRWITAAESESVILSLSTQLLQLGLIPGMLVAFRAERRPETVLLILALRRVGALICLTDPRQEITDALSESDTRITPDFLLRKNSSDEYELIKGSVSAVLSLKDLTNNPPSFHVSSGRPGGSPDDPAFIIFTSGSTGKSKAVVLSENNLISNLIDSAPLGYYSREDVALGALPLNHVFGLALLTGALVLEYSIYFPETISVQGLLECIEKQGITRMNGVPSLYLALAEESEKYDVSSLRAGFIGGGPVTPEQFARIEDKLGMTLIPVYGMSECVGISCASYQDPRAERAGGVGPIYPMNAVRILDEDGREAPCGSEGEICVCGPMRMLGYYGDVLPKDEFFHTGDLGYLDQKNVLHLSGRKKELIIRNGNNLSPRRIEEAFLSLPEIRSCTVVGLPNPNEGEIPAAMIIGNFEESELHKLLHKNEWPALVITADTIPMTASGKPDKQKVKEILLTCLNG